MQLNNTNVYKTTSSGNDDDLEGLQFQMVTTKTSSYDPFYTQTIQWSSN